MRKVELRSRIITEVDRETATLFAEPIITHRGDVSEIAWYCELGGAARPLSTLDPELRAFIEAKLRTRLAKLQPLLYSDIAPVLWGALQLARKDSILAIGDEPVLVQWGIAPEGETADTAAAGRRFASVIGLYAPYAYPDSAATPSAPGATSTTAPNNPPPPDPVAAASSRQGRGLQTGLVIATVAAAACALLLALPGVLATSGQGGDDLDTAAAITRAMREKVDRARAALGSFDCGPGGGATPAHVNPDLPPEPMPARATTTAPPPGSPQAQPDARPDTPTANPDAPSNPMALVARRAAESVVYILTCSDLTTWRKAVEQTGKPNAKPQACPLPQPGKQASGDLVAFASGSGFFIGPDRIVTNAHVVQNARSVIVASQSLALATLATVEATTTTTGPDPDFAVLSVSVPHPPPPLSLSFHASSLQNVVAAGYPGIIVEAGAVLGLAEGRQSLPDLTTFPGYVTVLKNSDGAVPFIFTSATIGHGNSGGPLLDLCASAIGVNTLGWSGEKEDTGYKVNVAEGTKALAAFLDAHNLHYQSATELCGAGEANGTAGPAGTGK